MPKYRQWEIWDVEWLHEDGSSKRRPALIISTTAYNDKHGAVHFVQLSSQYHNVRYRQSIAPGDPGFGLSGLTKKSYIYPANIQEIPKAHIYRRRGKISEFTGRLVLWSIRELTGSQPP